MRAVVVCPENFPKAKDVLERELALEGDEDPSEKSFALGATSERSGEWRELISIIELLVPRM